MNKDIETLIEKAFDLLEIYETKKAIKIGKKLKSLSHYSAFEILALAYDQDDKKSKAIEILEEGTSKAPDVWILWQLLGNYYSDVENYTQAYNSYEKALLCKEVRSDSVYLNFAIALTLDNQDTKALEYLDKIRFEDEEAYYYSQSVRLDILNSTGKYLDAIKLATFLIELESKPDSLIEKLPEIYAELGKAYWLSNANIETSLKYGWKAIKINKSADGASWLIREIENKYSPNSKYFRILVEGVWHEPILENNIIPGFYTSYDVVAENIEEAFKYLNRFEPEKIRPTLRIDEYKILEDSPEKLKGVYSVNGYSYFSED